MLEENINRFMLFLTLAQEQSFTKAAAKLNLSPSALSHSIKTLEQSMALRLFNRTTRSVSLTDAGEKLFEILQPKFKQIEYELQELNDEYHQAKGKIRISASDYAVEVILWPKLKQFAHQYPGIQIEINVENRLTDVVNERFDAGVREGSQVAKDMIAVRISPDIRFLVVGSKTYLEGKVTPQHPHDLLSHQCINMRLNGSGSLYAWELENQQEQIKLRVDGQFAFNTSTQILEAVLSGFGFGYLPEDLVKPHLNTGELIAVLEDWCPPSPGLFLYYPNRRQHKMAFQLLLDAIKETG